MFSLSVKKGPIQSSIWFKLVLGLLVPGPSSKVTLSDPHDPGMYMMKWHLNLFMTKKHVSSCGGLGPWGFRSSKSNKSNRSVIFPIFIFGFHLCVSRSCIAREVSFWNAKHEISKPHQVTLNPPNMKEMKPYLH